MAKESKESKPSVKKKQTPKLKNVLAYPFPQYWPEITAEQVEHLKILILGTQKNQNKVNAVNENLLMGLSKILRTINQNSTVYFFLSTDIKPKFVATQVINLTLSKHKSCKVLCVPNLHDLTKLLFGIGSIAFGYKNGDCPLVEKWIEETQQKHFPVPQRTLSYYAREIHKSSVPLMQKATKTIRESKNEINVTSFHLKRNPKQRAFIPRNADNTKIVRLDELERESTEWTDFISLSVNTGARIDRMEIDNDDNDDDDDDDDIEFEKQELTRSIQKLLSRTSYENNDSNKLKRDYAMESNMEKLKENIQRKAHKKKHQKVNQSEYIGLTVHRIQPNPKKVRKKKKKINNI